MKHNSAPRIETPRLILRAHALEDLPASTAMWGDPDVVRFIGGRVFSPEEVWARLLRYAGMWAMIGRGFWVIEDKATGKMIGEVGVMDAKRDMTPSLGDDPEIGWSLMPAAWGKGFASEAVGTALGWAEQNIDAPRQVCIIDPGNEASIRLAMKFGFRERLRTTYHGSQTIQFERVKGHG
jgi:RimJ/RimL family protein N-acetyltransferase